MSNKPTHTRTYTQELVVVTFKKRKKETKEKKRLPLCHVVGPNNLFDHRTNQLLYGVPATRLIVNLRKDLLPRPTVLHTNPLSLSLSSALTSLNSATHPLIHSHAHTQPHAQPACTTRIRQNPVQQRRLHEEAPALHPRNVPETTRIGESQQPPANSGQGGKITTREGISVSHLIIRECGYPSCLSPLPRQSITITITITISSTALHQLYTPAV
ncbi:hypothetical protein LZ31DRAFT_538332 [Colletotrichum somersetense]|nr:hypothetical protein LZ31DRAFT_538332 [Colletotrichum somersetense]